MADRVGTWLRPLVDEVEFYEARVLEALSILSRKLKAWREDSRNWIIESQLKEHAHVPVQPLYPPSFSALCQIKRLSGLGLGTVPSMGCARRWKVFEFRTAGLGMCEGFWEDCCSQCVIPAVRLPGRPLQVGMHSDGFSVNGSSKKWICQR